MNWLKPLDGGTWWNEQPRDPEKARGRVSADLPAKVERAKTLAEIYTREKVAELMKVSPATITRWLGVKYKGNKKNEPTS